MRRESKTDKVLALLRDGHGARVGLLTEGKMSMTEVAEQCGVSIPYVATLKKRLGRDNPGTALAVALETPEDRQRKFLENLIRTHGNMTEASILTCIDTNVPYLWVRNDAAFARKVEEIKEIAIDYVESALFRQIAADVPASTIFYLKTKAKHRGYVERTEVTGNEGRPLEIRVITPFVEFTEPDPERELLVTDQEQ